MRVPGSQPLSPRLCQGPLTRGVTTDRGTNAPNPSSPTGGSPPSMRWPRPGRRGLLGNGEVDLSVAPVMPRPRRGSLRHSQGRPRCGKRRGCAAEAVRPRSAGERKNHRLWGAHLAHSRRQHGDIGAGADQSDGGVDELHLTTHGFEPGVATGAGEVRGQCPRAGGCEELLTGQLGQVDPIPEADSQRGGQYRDHRLAAHHCYIEVRTHPGRSSGGRQVDQPQLGPPFPTRLRSPPPQLLRPRRAASGPERPEPTQRP
jgi:hypothetical protein